MHSSEQLMNKHDDDNDYWLLRLYLRTNIYEKSTKMEYIIIAKWLRNILAL